jgi:hypothetical protein
MNQDYSDIIHGVSQLLFQAIKERELNLAENVSQLDGELHKVLEAVSKVSKRSSSALKTLFINWL